MRDELGKPLPVEIVSQAAMLDSTPELVSQGEWICLSIQPNIAWPVRVQSLDFDGHRVWIIPITKECYPGVAIKRPPNLTWDEVERILYRLLSVISWREEGGITVVDRTGGSRPHMMGRDNTLSFSIRDSFDFTEVICPREEGPQMALALMREARSLNHHGYAFLSYWRILELAFPETRARVSWMETALPTLAGQGIQEALTHIGIQGANNICRHLFESGRCAIAHATGQPIINPDDPRDAARLFRELPLVREMATHAIEERFGIDTPITEYRKHLYELKGWKEKLGTDLIERILNGEEPRGGEKIDLPEINIRLLDSPPYLPFEGMTPVAAYPLAKGLNLEYRTTDRLAGIRVRLSLPDERMLFEIDNDLSLRDDGSVIAAQYHREIQRFARDYFLNGVLQIWDAGTNKLLSRLDAFIPINCMIDLDACNAAIAETDVEVMRRRSAPPQPA